MKRLTDYIRHVRHHWRLREAGGTGGLDILRYIGPGLLVTVGFIDPGNWASNFAAGSEFGYALLWVVTLSTVMLVVLQHNVAHLGIATGLCLAEATTRHLRPAVARPVLWSAMAASVSTSLAEILGAAIALEMLFGLPVALGAAAAAAVTAVLLFTNSYRRVEKGIIAFVSLIGFSYLYELTLVDTDWAAALRGVVTPSLPAGSMLVVMSVLGAVVMPHNLFLHSEVVQSRAIHTQGDAGIRRALKYEFWDTLLAMTVGWAINSAMIVLAATTFFVHGVAVDSAGARGGRGVCRGAAVGRTVEYRDEWHGGRHHFCRALRRTLRRARRALACGHPPLAGAGLRAHPLYRRCLSRADTLAGRAEPATARYGVPASQADVVAPRHGPVCQQSHHDRRALPHRRARHRP